MDKAQEQPPTSAATPKVQPGHFNPVNVHIDNSLGALLLGILAFILLVGWMKAEARNRQLMGQQ